VKAVVKGDNFERSIPFLLAPLARKFDGPFVRLCSAVREEDPIQTGEFCKQIRQTAARCNKPDLR
jgi:hypothetical protein